MKLGIKDLVGVITFILNHPLNKRDRLKALSRFFTWQIVSRLITGPIGFPFIEKAKLFAKRGMTGATGNYYCGLHEVEEMGFVLHVLRKGEHFVDIGANIGSYTILACAGPQARVTAIEPIPETFLALKDNIYLNRYNEVSAHNIGLSDKPGKLWFTSDSDTVNHVLAKNEIADHTIEVQVKRLDDLIGDDFPVIIKVDVEGYELSILHGMKRVLSSHTLLAVVMETNDCGSRYGHKDKQLFNFMKKYDFHPFNYDPFERDLAPVKKQNPNTIFVRDSHEILSRVKSAKYFQVGTKQI